VKKEKIKTFLFYLLMGLIVLVGNLFVIFLHIIWDNPNPPAI
jgi:hypothetical protein